MPAGRFLALGAFTLAVIAVAIVFHAAPRASAQDLPADTVRDLGDYRETVRQTAADELVNRGAMAVDPVIAIANGEDHDGQTPNMRARMEACTVLGRIAVASRDGGIAQVSQELLNRAAAGLSAIALDAAREGHEGQPTSLRLAALAAMAEFLQSTGDATVSAIGAIRQSLSDPEPDMQVLAAHLAGSRASITVIREALVFNVNTEKPHLTAARLRNGARLARAMARPDDPAVVAFATRCAEIVNNATLPRTLRHEGAYALGNITDPAGITPLMAILSDPGFTVDVQAAIDARKRAEWEAEHGSGDGDGDGGDGDGDGGDGNGNGNGSGDGSDGSGDNDGDSGDGNGDADNGNSDADNDNADNSDADNSDADNDNADNADNDNRNLNDDATSLTRERWRALPTTRAEAERLQAARQKDRNALAYATETLARYGVAVIPRIVSSFRSEDPIDAAAISRLNRVVIMVGAGAVTLLIDALQESTGDAVGRLEESLTSLLKDNPAALEDLPNLTTLPSEQARVLIRACAAVRTAEAVAAIEPMVAPTVASDLRIEAITQLRRIADANPRTPGERSALALLNPQLVSIAIGALKDDNADVLRPALGVLRAKLSTVPTERDRALVAIRQVLDKASLEMLIAEAVDTLLIAEPTTGLRPVLTALDKVNDDAARRVLLLACARAAPTDRRSLKDIVYKVQGDVTNVTRSDSLRRQAIDTIGRFKDITEAGDALVSALVNPDMRDNRELTKHIVMALRGYPDGDAIKAIEVTELGTKQVTGVQAVAGVLGRYMTAYRAPIATPEDRTARSQAEELLRECVSTLIQFRRASAIPSLLPFIEMSQNGWDLQVARFLQGFTTARDAALYFDRLVEHVLAAGRPDNAKRTAMNTVSDSIERAWPLGMGDLADRLRDEGLRTEFLRLSFELIATTLKNSGYSAERRVELGSKLVPILGHPRDEVVRAMLQVYVAIRDPRFISNLEDVWRKRITVRADVADACRQINYRWTEPR